MKKEKEEPSEKTDEIKDEIDSALKDPKGIVSHQKRLAFVLSLGMTELLEDYLRKKNVLKPGFKINHQWLKKKKENVMQILKEKTTSLDHLDKLDRLLDTAFEIESKRNELAYGALASEDLLKELIDTYLKIKKEIEQDE